MIETNRLIIRKMNLSDASFILKLQNDSDWRRFISDRGEINLTDAEDYIRKIIQGYERDGFGLFLVTAKDNNVALGICGVLKRDYLDDIDLGFAFLPEFRGQGYCQEACDGVLKHAQSLGWKRVVAITLSENIKSIRVLEKMDFNFEKTITPPNGKEPLFVYARKIEFTL